MISDVKHLQKVQEVSSIAKLYLVDNVSVDQAPTIKYNIATLSILGGNQSNENESSRGKTIRLR